MIGGVFGLESEVGPGRAQAAASAGRVLSLANARSGIWIAVQHIQPPQVWMPSYLCSSMLDGVPDRARVRYYDVDYDLKLSDVQWIEDVGQGDLVCFIDFFGYLADRRLLQRVKARGGWILEDACQALFTESVGEVADFVLYSPRKFVGVPDGGIFIIAPSVPIGDIMLQAPPEEWWLTSFRATLFRRDFDRGGNQRDWFDLFRKAEASIPTGPYAMSTLSAALISRVNAPAIAHRRRANYAFLLERLAQWAVLPELPDGVVPLGFPIRTRQRDRVRQRLFADDIFPPVHWAIGGVVPLRHHQSHRLSAEIMTLPCDQRYGLEEMGNLADATLRALTGEAT